MTIVGVDDSSQGGVSDYDHPVAFAVARRSSTFSQLLTLSVSDSRPIFKAAVGIVF